jgi:GNAT superfamily N-acetyltransferase
MESGTTGSLDTMIRPQGLHPIRNSDGVEWIPARVTGSKGSMSWRMPILREHHMRKTEDQAIHGRNHQIALGHRQCSSGAEIILNINDQQHIAICNLNRHISEIVYCIYTGSYQPGARLDKDRCERALLAVAQEIAQALDQKALDQREPLPIHIREAFSEDAPAIAVLCDELGYPATPEIIRSKIEKLRSLPEEAIFVACMELRIIAWIHVSVLQSLQSETHALIGGLVVTEDCRSARIGAQLVAHAEQWARNKGVQKIRVRSQIAREAAHRFYLREGYSHTKVSAVFEKKL